MCDINDLRKKQLWMLSVEEFIFIQNYGKEDMQPKNESKFITVDGLCQLTGLSKTTIYIKSSKKELPGAKKIGGKLLFDRDVIMEWIESGVVKTRSKILNDLEKGGAK